MKKLPFGTRLLWLALSGHSLSAQTASDTNEGLQITRGPSVSEFTVSWWTRPDHFYFLQTTEDLVNDPWAYFDYAELGDSSVGGLIMSLSADKMFFRVDVTNDRNSPLLVLDQDGDKVSTVEELLKGTDPFLSQSLDGDTLPDDWEIFHGLDTTPGVDSSADDSEPDGASAATEFSLDLDPAKRDHPDVSLTLN